MQKWLGSVVLVAALALVGTSCMEQPPSTPPVGGPGTGCRDLPYTDLSGQRQSIRWDGSYTGEFEIFANDTCQAPSFVQWTAYRLAIQGDLDSTVPIANEACVALAEVALPDAIVFNGPFTYRYLEFLVGNLGDTSGVPEDLWMCAVSYIDSEGNGRVWPTDTP